MCNAGVDIHTGGAYASFIPLAYVCRGGDEAVFSASVALAEAFNPPWIYSEAGVKGGIDPEARKLRVAFFSTELGGGSRLGGTTTQLARRGVRNVLVHLGVLSGPVETEPGEPCRYLTDADACRLMSPVPGFLESVCGLGQTVSAGETLAIVHPLEDAFVEPTSLTAPGDGVVVSMRTTARVQPDDIVLDTAREVTRQDIFAGAKNSMT